MSPAAPRTVLVVGATGIVGSAAVEHFAALPDHRVVALARRPVPEGPTVRSLTADLMDATACRAALATEPGITDVLYTALFEKPDLVAGWRDPGQMDVNLAMFRNLLDALRATAPRLRHVTLLQGTKAYGLHATQIPVPAKERWPRGSHAVFYWAQEDLLRERQRDGDWHFSILRPQLILGSAVGSPMNIVAAIGVYAAVRRELGLPLAFPGGGRYVHGATDSRLIARAAAFCADTPAAREQTFNVVNGDVFVWQDLFPAVARHFDMPLGEPEPLRLATAMPDHEPAWSRLAERHGLRVATMSALLGSSWQFADRSFGCGLEAPLDRIASPIKLRQAGFADCADTEDVLVAWLERLQAQRLIPR